MHACLGDGAAHGGPGLSMSTHMQQSFTSISTGQPNLCRSLLVILPNDEFSPDSFLLMSHFLADSILCLVYNGNYHFKP